MERFKFEAAKLLGRVEYEGIRYNWLWLSAPSQPGHPQNVPTVIAENDSGYCEMPLFDPAGAIHSQKDVEKLLGKPVSDMFVEQMADNDDVNGG